MVDIFFKTYTRVFYIIRFGLTKCKKRELRNPHFNERIIVQKEVAYSWGGVGGGREAGSLGCGEDRRWSWEVGPGVPPLMSSPLFLLLL